MDTRDATYAALRAAAGTRAEMRAVLGGTSYGMDVLMSAETAATLFSGDSVGVGGACAGEISISMLADSVAWPRAAKFTLEYRLVGTTSAVSNWYPVGHYTTDTRADSSAGVLSVTGYDAMLEAECPFLSGEEDARTWPITSAAAVAMILALMDWTLDARTVLNDEVGVIPYDSEATVRQVLQAVAAANGGNWCFTPAGALRLVTLADAPAGPDIGLAVSNLDTAAALPAVTGILLTAEDGTQARAGTEDGYVLAGSAKWATPAMAQLCLAAVHGVVYRPVIAEGALIDPAVELGDAVTVDGAAYPLCAMRWIWGVVPRCDIEAPFEAEVDHEYPYIAPALRAAQSAFRAASAAEAELETQIQQTATDITTRVAANYYNKAESGELISGVASQVVQTKDALEVGLQTVRAEANGQYHELHSYIRFEGGELIIGLDGYGGTFRISPEQLSACWDGEPTSFWNRNEQRTPRKLTIPLGGSLQMGAFQWTPRSSGNVSLLWVGG